MIKNELTKEEIARVFAMYWRSQCLFRLPSVKRAEIMELSGSHIDRSMVDAECKLLLIPLSKITNEHAIEVAVLESDYPNLNLNTYRRETFKWAIERVGTKTTVTAYYKAWFSGDKIHTLSHTFDINFAWPNTELKNATIQYLIQQEHAVPLFFGINHWANGKTAIELDIAFDKTTYV